MVIFSNRQQAVRLINFQIQYRAELKKCFVDNLISLPDSKQLLPLSRHFNEWKDNSVLQSSGLHHGFEQKFTVDMLNSRLANNGVVNLARHDASGQWISVTCPRPMVFVKLVFLTDDKYNWGSCRVEYLIE